MEAVRLHRVRERTKTGRTLLEGPHLIGEAVRAGAEMHRVFVREGETPPDVAGSEVVVVDERVMGRLAGTETPRGPVAVVVIPESMRPRGVTALVAWGLGDPGNLGTLIRSGAAFGLPVVVGPGTVDPWSPKVLRAGAGGHFRIPITSAGSVDELADLRLLATVVDGGTHPKQLDAGPWAVLIGSEPHGLPNEVTRMAETVTIPMRGGMESLNAGVAGAILAYVISGHGHATGSSVQ